jgi:hypothetical protein
MSVKESGRYPSRVKRPTHVTICRTYYRSYDTSVRLSFQQSSGCFASTRAGEIVQILVCHPAFYEEHDTSEEDCCLTCGLINIRQ